MRVFTLSIECENEAFEPEPTREVARLLRVTADTLQLESSARSLLDANGNTVGRWRFEELEVRS